MIIHTHVLNQQQQIELMKCWNEVYPVNLQFEDVAQVKSYFDGLEQVEYFLLIDASLSATAFSFRFIRDDELWLAMLMPPSMQGKGYGTILLEELTKDVDSISAWVVDHDRELKADGSPYISPLKFYVKNGFEIQEGVRLEIDSISAVKLVWKRL
ncbi:MAG: GNAT family N-acetyltransferase [Bacteroidetes bacterium]|nr:GNAT family N-acetyltransferase [Bacteroidota bacterium]